MQVDGLDPKIRQTSDYRRREAGYHMSLQKSWQFKLDLVNEEICMFSTIFDWPYDNFELNNGV